MSSYHLNSALFTTSTAVLLLVSSPARAQLGITPTKVAQTLQDALVPPGSLPPGVTITGFTIIPAAANIDPGETLGTFTGFSFPRAVGDLSLGDGICLSTGDLQRANGDPITSNASTVFCPGPLNSDSCGNNQDGPAAEPQPGSLYGTSQLSADPAGVELTFNVDPSAMGTTVRIRAVMGSEEFPEYAAGLPTAPNGDPPGQCFTDTFGAYLDGPLNNIALLPPDASFPNNKLVNVAKGVIAFNNNTSPAENHNLVSRCGQDLTEPGAFEAVTWAIEYDGLTDAMTFDGTFAIPGTHTLKLIVTDIGEDKDSSGNPDHVLDSAVFLAALEFCPPQTVIVSSDPTDGWIDPLSESDSGSPPQDTERIKKFTINFSSLVFNQDGTALSPAAFAVTTTDNPDPDIPAPPTLSIANVDATNNPTVVVTLDQPIPFGEWTTLAINVENACGVDAPTFYIDVGHLPDDTNQDGQVNTNDATLFGSLFNGAKPLELVDVDRNGQVNINDATMFGQLWNGTSGFLEWLGKGLPAEPTH